MKQITTWVECTFFAILGLVDCVKLPLMQLDAANTNTKKIQKYKYKYKFKYKFKYNYKYKYKYKYI